MTIGLLINNKWPWSLSIKVNTFIVVPSATAAPLKSYNAYVQDSNDIYKLFGHFFNKEVLVDYNRN
jgi:hypothetical protein